jgi:hypothetical protein
MENIKTDQPGNSRPESDKNSEKTNETSKPLQEIFDEQQGIYKNNDG